MCDLVVINWASFESDVGCCSHSYNCMIVWNQYELLLKWGDSFLFGISFFFKLKEYYEIIDEARPLSGFFPTHADFFTEMHF